MKVKRSKSRIPEPSSSNEYKRPRIIDSDQKDDDQLESNLLNLSDDVLLNIMKYLSPQDLMALSLCCQRLDQVTRDRTLWNSVDFRKSRIMLDDLEKYVKFFRPWITKLRIRGNLQSDEYQGLSQSFFTAIGEICNRLKELTVEEYAIDAHKIQITDFPRMIETLSLKGCDLFNLQTNKSYFFKMELHMPNLTCLILSDCEWFTPHSLMVISKMPKLKELRLDSCHRLSECLAYASLATKFGFKTLEVLDLRDTPLGDSEISCFKSTKTLTHLYLECPPVLRKVSRPPEDTPPLEQPMHRPVFEDHNLLQLLVDEGNLMPRRNFELCLVSDRAVCALGSYVCDQRILNSIEGMIFVEEDRRIVNNPNLKALVVRYYSQVTNQSLVHLAANASSLEYLDVTGTAVTREGVQTFRSQKPNVEILSSFDET